MCFGKKCGPNTKVNNLFLYTLDIYISVTSPRPLESDELNRSVPSLVSSLVIDSDVSPFSVGILSKGAKSKFSYFYSKSVSVQHTFSMHKMLITKFGIVHTNALKQMCIYTYISICV